MSAAEWAVVIAAIGTVALQVIGRLQAWQLAVIALRSEHKQETRGAVLVEKVSNVDKMLDGTTSKLTEQVAALAKENAMLREQIVGFRERDATTAQLAREHKME